MITIGHSEVKKAYRVMYEAAIGPIPVDAFVLHSCDMPSCINPSHLHLGDHDQNMREMWSRGRGAHGERVPQSKLKKAEVLQIRDLARYGYTQHEIAAIYKIDQSNVHYIVTRKSWKRI